MKIWQSCIKQPQSMEMSWISNHDLCPSFKVWHAYKEKAGSTGTHGAMTSRLIPDIVTGLQSALRSEVSKTSHEANITSSQLYIYRHPQTSGTSMIDKSQQDKHELQCNRRRCSSLPTNDQHSSNVTKIQTGRNRAQGYLSMRRLFASRWARSGRSHH